MATIKAIVSSIEVDKNESGASIMVRGQYLGRAGNPVFGISVPISSGWWALGVFTQINMVADITSAVIDAAGRDHSLTLAPGDVLISAPIMG